MSVFSGVKSLDEGGGDVDGWGTDDSRDDMHPKDGESVFPSFFVPASAQQPSTYFN